jgi:hypothetical protein
MAVTPEQNGHLFPLGNGRAHSRYKFLTVSITKRLRNSRFNSETTAWWLQN